MVRTRFAPSPTGLLHIGGVRTALFSWAYAKKRGGEFVLRIEDTDQKRSTQESVAVILQGLKWLNLDYQQGPYFQSQRFNRYREVIQDLLQAGKAYYCYTSSQELSLQRDHAEKQGKRFFYDRTWRPEEGKTLPPIPEGITPVVRFKMPKEGETAWHDWVKGNLSFQNDQIDDFIIARSDGTPTYNLCVVVDDWDSGISHVIRGDDHVNNTPKQIQILKALEAPVPEYAHLPMIFNDKGQKMSKRRDPVSIADYEKMGILPEALLNYLARLGWAHGDEELFSRQQFIEWFDFKQVSPSPSRFNMDKLLWVNAAYIKKDLDLSAKIAFRLEEIGLQSDEKLPLIVNFLKDRSRTLNELAQEASYFYRKGPEKESHAQELLSAFKEQLKNIEPWDKENLHLTMNAFIKEKKLKMKDLAMPLRRQLLGVNKSASIDETMAILGKGETLKRLSI